MTANLSSEYLIKQYLQTSKEEPIYLEMWDQALAGVRKHLITYSQSANFTVLAERPRGLSQKLSPKMDHLVCFMPGTIALGATGGLPLFEARKSKQWGTKQEEEMNLARELTKTCWGMYKNTATGLAPEITYFNIHDPPHMEAHGVLSSSTDMSNTSEGAAWKSDYIIKSQDSHNLQRPETVETLFYMWRITGDEIYRDWGWEMFKSFVEYTTVEGGAGFTSLSFADQIPPIMKDNMESFWLVSCFITIGLIEQIGLNTSNGYLSCYCCFYPSCNPLHFRSATPKSFHTISTRLLAKRPLPSTSCYFSSAFTY